VYDHFQDLGNDYRSHEDVDESELEEFWTPTPETLAAHSYEMLNQPSVEFIRQLWWESLTRYYGGPRALAPRRIMEDLSHLLVLAAPISLLRAEIFLVEVSESPIILLHCTHPPAFHLGGREANTHFPA
jgi:hypothetical protein